MALVTNTRLLFNKIPTGYPIPGETTVIDRKERIDLNTPLNGGVLIKVLVVAIDPYIRGRMRDPKIESYAPPLPVGKPVDNYGVGVVVRSEDPKAKAGDHLYGFFEFQSYVFRKDISEYTVLQNKENLQWPVYLGTLGMPGQTAYVGWKKYTKGKKGETIFVTSAAGPVGSVVVQLAKADGLKVIASTGSDDKVAFVKQLGADIVFNYKTKSTRQALQEVGHGIDIYWDHVGGEMLEAALEAANNYARIIICGAIASYNSPEPYGVKNLHYILSKRLSVQGYIVLDHSDWLPEFFSVMPQKVASGEIKHREQIYYGFDGAEQAIVENQKGENTAKPVAELAHE